MDIVGSSISPTLSKSFDDGDIYNGHVDISDVDERKLLRKIDIVLVPWLSFLYALSFLDRTSIGKYLYNLEADLHITDSQYLLALTVFFFSYALFEVPSNVLLKRLHPSLWLSSLMLLWGIVMTVQGLVHNYGGLLGIRWMLGMFEACLYPGVAFYLSCWYKRTEFGLRVAVFFSASTVSGAFGGLLAAAISNMDGIGGKPAWAWIFILEGLLTVLAALASYWIIQDFPDTAKFLSEAERTVVIRRLQADSQFSAAGEKFKMKYIKQSLLDWKTWVGMMTFAGGGMPLYASALFLPSIINEVSYTATRANLLTVPIYVLACIVTCIVGFFGDRRGQRVWLALNNCIGAAGYIILIASRSAPLSYFATFLAVCGICPVLRKCCAWFSNNIEGTYKRGVTLAMIISFGNLNGAVSSNVYRASDEPWYTLDVSGMVLMYIGLGMISSIVCLFLLDRENKKRDRGERDEIIGDITITGNEKNGRFATLADAKREKGDRWSGYRYTL
ncbi:MFS general substrate transporter [Armillaria luteobubalina]|uniref:MFS general substrate transporter n=1 Tax=Armillaria luteobubalina TaxID=153913 RepID=A0AA39QET1_9AGAR|nr:MFS general substrate transporter [Armillaria luteobubalina]